MKQIGFALAFTLTLAALVPFLRAADDVPKAQAFARYEPMMKRSPFAVATAVALPSATPNFAKDLYVANAAHTPDGDLVTLASSVDKNFKKYLSTKAPVDGYSVPHIAWSEHVGATRVTISKDGQTATLTFNQALLSQSAPNMPPVIPPPQPQPQGVGVPAVPQYMSPNVNPGVVKQPGIVPPPLPTPPPSRVRGVIPRRPNPNPGVQEKEMLAQPAQDDS